MAKPLEIKKIVITFAIGFDTRTTDRAGSRKR